MAYEGHFTDRNPDICAAGLSGFDVDNNVFKCVHYSTLNDKIQALKHDVEEFDKDNHIKYDLPLCKNNRKTGLYNKMRFIIRPNELTRFQHLVQDLKSTTQDSYWNTPIGRRRDEIPLLPKGMCPIVTKFGKASPIEPPLSEVVNPPIPYCQVFRNDEVGHEMYAKTHNDYYPGEQMHRKYNNCFNPKKTFGIRTNTDKVGVLVKNALHWDNNSPESIGNEDQAIFEEKHIPQLGKCLTPNKNINCVEPNHTFGNKSNIDRYNMADLLREGEPNRFKTELRSWVAHANKLKIMLKRRTTPEFDFFDFYDRLRYYDKQKVNWLPKEVVYEMCKELHIPFDKCRLEPLMELIGIYAKGCIDYKRFVDMLHWRCDYLPIIDDLAPYHKYYETSSEAAYQSDPKMLDNSKMPTAGLASIRADTNLPGVDPLRGCKAHHVHLGAESTIKTYLSPSIYTQYDLSHRDFYKPRPKEQIKQIFKNVMNLGDEPFEFLWNEAVKTDGNDVCIETIRNLIKKFYNK